MSIRSSAPKNYAATRLADRLMRGLLVAATLVAIVPLVLIIGYVLVNGGRALNADFFTKTYVPPFATGIDTPAIVPPVAEPGATPAEPGATPDPFANIDIGAIAGAAAGAAPAQPAATPAADGVPGATPDPFANIDIGAVTGASGAPGAAPADATAVSGPVAHGGVLHGIVGTLLVTALGLLIALPVGIMSAIFLAEYPANRLATIVRFCCDVLSGAPSIIAGVVVYVLVVRYRGADGRPLGFSGLAGSLAIALLMIPTVVRTTEEILRLVPEGVREAARALGATTWYSTLTVVLPAALPGIVTGAILAFARGAGETAPLLLTVLGNNELTFSLLGPIAALPLLAYRYTETPFPSENALAWGAAFVLMMLVLLVNILARLATRRISAR